MSPYDLKNSAKYSTWIHVLSVEFDVFAKTDSVTSDLGLNFPK